MPIIPRPVQALIDAFEQLPGIGPKSASRLVFFLLRTQGELTERLAEALTNLKNNTGQCPECFNIMALDQPLCEICQDEKRNALSICVVEDALDVLAVERTGGYQGKYHVLGGLLSPIEGIGPDDLKIRPLIERIKTQSIQEVILATNPSMEGDATALYLRQQLAAYNIRITRLARGLPMGSDLEYADQVTILRALSGRQDM